ncbi:hypothetical protein CHISP_3518 [Chitinispirillum alkaliphilum]|nr:hypothetical protein CHISP_3518 [Chitinispirillum alkaliphilum]
MRKKMENNPVNRCEKCDAYCCRHIAVQIDTPETENDFDIIRWYLLHHNVWVSIDHDDNWILEFKTPCRNITENFLCGDYQNRPSICREYPQEEELCEKETGEPSYTSLFTCLEEFEEYLRENRNKTLI